MRSQGAIFLAIAFVAYWLLTNEPETQPSMALGPVTPGLVRVPNPPYDLEEPVTPQDSGPLKDPREDLRKWLHVEAKKIGVIDNDPTHTQVRLNSFAARLTKKDSQALKQAALDRALPTDERFLAVYILGLASDGALDALRELSLARIPGVPDDRRHSDEVILRTQAIEALVQKLSPVEARATLMELLSRTSDPIIARHVQYWINRLSS